MKLLNKDIEHIANLARLDLSKKELKMYGGQLSDILEYVDQLQEVDTNNVEITAQVTGLENVYREDEAKNWNDNEKHKALEQAAELENGQIKVKRVIQ